MDIFNGGKSKLCCRYSQQANDSFVNSGCIEKKTPNKIELKMVFNLILVANKLLYSFLFSMSQNKLTMRVAPSWLLTHRKLEPTYPVILLVLRVFTDENEPGPEPPSWVSLFSVLCICYQFNILINQEFTFPGYSMGTHPLYIPWKKIFPTLHPAISKKFSPVLRLFYALIVSESLYLILREVISKQKYNDDRSASNSLPKRSTLREIKVLAYWAWVEKRLWTIECRPDSSLQRLSPYFIFFLRWSC